MGERARAASDLCMGEEGIELGDRGGCARGGGRGKEGDGGGGWAGREWKRRGEKTSSEGQHLLLQLYFVGDGTPAQTGREGARWGGKVELTRRPTRWLPAVGGAAETVVRWPPRGTTATWNPTRSSTGWQC